MSITIQFPDGSSHEYGSGTTGAQIAGSIGKGLARDAIAIDVNGELRDLTLPIEEDAHIRIVTFKDPEGRDIYRHSSSHIMALAIKRLYPETNLAIGPAITDGFYYDLDLETRLSEDDFPRIEEEMKKIVKEEQPFVREEMNLEDAKNFFEKIGEKYKVELLEDMEDATSISFYRNGEFVDLCRGPHLPSTGRLKAFKLTSVAGAYWRGDEHREMLQRVYGTSFPDNKMLKEHLQLIEEAKKRDHRVIGKALDLFSFHEEAPGFPFFHAKGSILHNTMMTFCREELASRGYTEIMTPIILNEGLWHRSGHWDHYQENMYFTRIDERPYAVKPMNCPGGLLVYKTKIHSYRELPLRVAEFGKVHRHELSGVLHGLFRVRAFTQDDAHVFCLPEQLEDEINGIIDFISHFLTTFGFKEFDIHLSTRPEKSIGSDEIWERAEGSLKSVLEKREIEYTLDPGEGTFYGPKIDFHIRDCLKRTWQCGTVQVDFSMPERFDLTYVGADGERHRPVMVHRAIFGSIERFMGVLIEHYAGNFPLWLAPVQVAVLPIADRHAGYSLEIDRRLTDAGFRTTIDTREETVGHKIREAELQKIPYILVVGDREVESEKVALRRHQKGPIGVKTLEEVIADLRKEVEEKQIVT